MSRRTRRIGALLAPGAALALWLVLGALLLRSTLTPEQDGALSAALGSAAGPLIGVGALWWLAAAGLGAWAAGRVRKLWAAPAARLTDSLRVMAENPAAPAPAPEGAPEIRALTAAVSDLAERRKALQDSLDARVREASAAVAHERDQLAALMAELQQSVVVCNLEGRILLYNGRARALTKRLSRSPGGAGGVELMGLGRSIHGVVDAARLDHARETVERRQARGEGAASARFVAATPEGRLLQVGMAPVRSGGEGAMTGFVLMFDDVTEEHAAQIQRDRHLQGLIEASRSSFTSMQAALDTLDYPDLQPDEREQFQQVVRDEVGAMSARLETTAAEAARDARIRWPLQDMLGADLLSAAARRMESGHGASAAVEEAPEDLWLSVDSFGLIEALAFLGGRLATRLKAQGLSLRLAPAGGWAHLDIVWRGEGAPAAETLSGWLGEAMNGEGGPSVRDLAERHGGEIWLERDRKRDLAFFRFLLPAASGAEAADSETLSSRPEYYDFNLFAASEASRHLDDRPLTGLAYTVFDTETTGLNPSGGDEIIQIGAARIVNGRILRGELFEQLVDPRRDIPEAGIPIHGVTPEMVRGKPTIGEVLPVFHAFAADTALVGHNVAFDMRFLALKEEQAGVRFDQPVLDTLLLSSILHPDATSHSLDSIAGRLGVKITGRHTAAGDALATAEVFLKLLPLLQHRGIETFGQARKAAQESYYARLKY
ncbi:exonuclease domain-containing protein [Neomegalonema sp.]|uniref:3'-5' exonuclease n=1 Tax=Neomegalonema sp. TaxID=2039713 RepID=UPI002628117C|nr:exonuclease domain-containing protein [Neomegalonema sp.]MDD2867441.1 exonuclease domain-containing protein [Neomegalonema sp.]